MLLMMMAYVFDDGDDNHDDDHDGDDDNHDDDHDGDDDDDHDDNDDDDVHDPGSADGMVRLWDLRKLASTKMLEGMRSSSFSLHFTAADAYNEVDACSDGAADLYHQSSLSPP